jgi:hypothetical protein
MLLTQCQGHGIERVLVGGAPRAGLVGGREAFGLVAEALEQLTDGSGAEVQGVGDGGGGLTKARPPLHEPA